MEPPLSRLSSVLPRVTISEPSVAEGKTGNMKPDRSILQYYHSERSVSDNIIQNPPKKQRHDIGKVIVLLYPHSHTLC